MKHQRTFSITKLKHQFNLTDQQLDLAVTKLYEHRFIDVFQHPEKPDQERYIELLKMIDKKCKDELFKLIGSIKNEK